MKKNTAILIVDDNINFADRMIEILGDLDNISHIDVARDYEEGFRLFVQEKPDLVLLDINLPGKNGIELLKAIKTSGYNSEVIMITNHTDDYYRKQCKEFGAEHFLDKTNDFGLVLGIISKRA